MKGQLVLWQCSVYLLIMRLQRSGFFTLANIFLSTLFLTGDHELTCYFFQLPIIYLEATQGQTVCLVYSFHCWVFLMYEFISSILAELLVEQPINQKSCSFFCLFCCVLAVSLHNSIQLLCFIKLLYNKSLYPARKGKLKHFGKHRKRKKELHFKTCFEGMSCKMHLEAGSTLVMDKILLLLQAQMSTGAAA